MSKRKRVSFKGVIVMIGFILSPLTLWNDAFVNIPISLAFAALMSKTGIIDFAPALLIGYALTNIIGIILMIVGGASLWKDVKIYFLKKKNRFDNCKLD